MVGHDKTVSYIKFVDTMSLVSASIDNTLKLWDMSMCRLGIEGRNYSQCLLLLLLAFAFYKELCSFVFIYHKAFPMPALSFKFYSSDPLSGNEEDDSAQFITSVCWRGIAMKFSKEWKSFSPTGASTIFHLHRHQHTIHMEYKLRMSKDKAVNISCNMVKFGGCSSSVQAAASPSFECASSSILPRDAALLFFIELRDLYEVPEKATLEACQENDDIGSITFTSNALDNDRGLSLDMNDFARPIVDGKWVVPLEVVDREEEESDDKIIDLEKDEESDYIDEANNSGDDS
ncbi:hypothetical protein JHK87_016262 [Glycine soja]|nr:hypothetical protein JHK87_016262 [Glycine soja]